MLWLTKGVSIRLLARTWVRCCSGRTVRNSGSLRGLRYTLQERQGRGMARALLGHLAVRTYRTWAKALSGLKPCGRADKSEGFVGSKPCGRADSNPACLCCSSAHLVQCEPDEASSFTNPNVGPGTYASSRLKLDAWSSAVQWGQRRQKCSSPTRR